MGFSKDEPAHLFTPQEAMRLLPDIKLKLREIMERKRVADTLRDEVERFSLVGFEVPEATEKTNQLDYIVKDLMGKISELEDLGIKLRDIDTGLLDFPAKRFGETVFLCWKFGEQSIEFWHSETEGFASRKHLNAQIVSP
ncbi:MAG: DUF2203 domain-containing protein [Thaumarchaeota archaeon]|nr:DUF2203 domain-containing protein [Nitrososphaerota archaeon]